MSKREKRAPTIREVAKLANVGLMTVSRVLNNHPSIRPTTRVKVEAAIAKLGYRQNEAARMMKGQRSRTIGLIVPDLSDQFFASCAHTIQHIAREHGYMTLVVSSERDAELEIEQAQLMSNRMLSGLLIVPSARAENKRLRQLQDAGLAIVALDRPLAGAETDAVVAENRVGAEEATQHLIEHGHRHIACVGYDEEAYTIQERITGFRSQMLAHGLEPRLVTGLDTLERAREWVSATMRMADRSTAVFALNHRTSGHLLRAFAEQGVRVPEDMAIIGFDDFDLSDITRPAFTAVAQSSVDLARRSIHLLLQRIREKHTGEPVPPAKIVLPAKLMIRESCGEHRAWVPLI